MHRGPAQHRWAGKCLTLCSALLWVQKPGVQSLEISVMCIFPTQLISNYHHDFESMGLFTEVETFCQPPSHTCSS